MPPERADIDEPFYPLQAHVCRGCGLVQLPQFEPAASIFDQYLYYSSYSESWLRHAESLRRGDDCAHQLSEQHRK
ncbi:hypothetical protein ACU4GH_18845 [Bradyrhizobium betae]